MKKFSDDIMLEIKENLRTQKDRSIKNNSRVDGVKEEDNESWKGTEVKLLINFKLIMFVSSSPKVCQ